MRQFMTAMGAGVGSIAVMGGATLVVSSVTLNIVKRVVKHQKMKQATACTVCTGSGYVNCDICKGKGIIRSRAPVSLKSLMQRAKETGSMSMSPVEPVMCACPACGTTLRQRCLNCLGEGKL